MVHFGRVVQMLKHCAPGFQLKPGKHKIRVLWQGKTYLDLPKGAHGARAGRQEIEVGYVVDMVQLFGIQECAKQYLDVLR